MYSIYTPLTFTRKQTKSTQNIAARIWLTAQHDKQKKENGSKV